MDPKKQINKTLLVLGAGKDQCFLIQTAKQMGNRVLAVDINPYAEGFNFADEFAVISNRDVPELKAYFSNYLASGKRIDGVTTMGSDIPDVVAEIADFLNLPGLSQQTAFRAKNKYEMIKRFKQCDVPIPWFKKITSFDELKKIIVERGYPLIIKPTDSSGSRGVFYLEKNFDIKSLFNESRSYSSDGTCLIEEYLDGLQISTETIMYEGKGITPGFADRNYSVVENFHPRIIENGGWMPTCLSEKQQKQVKDIVEKASLALGVTDGITKGDVVFTKDGPKMIEMAARLSGGDFSESLVPLSSGINYVKAAIKIALGEKVNFNDYKPIKHKFVANRYFFHKPGRLIDIQGVEEVRRQEWVIKIDFFYSIDDELPFIRCHGDRFGVFIITADNREELSERIDWVYKKIKIVVK
ncbi:MAG: ATP-grasp domain-containing protein [Syntrophomonas sp.]